MVAKHSINPKNYYFADTLDATQIAALPEELDGTEQVSIGTNLNFELIPLPWGDGTGGVSQTETTFGFGRVTLAEGTQCNGGRIQKRTK